MSYNKNMRKKSKKFLAYFCMLSLLLSASMLFPVKATAAARKNQTIQASNITVRAGEKNRKVNAKARTSLSYKSSDPSVVGVSSQGILTPKKGGTVKVTIYAKATSKYDSATRTVTVSVKRLNATTVTLRPDRTYRNYDVTGDQKKDTILVRQKGFGGYAYTGLEIYINGKKQPVSTHLSYFFDTDIKLYTLENGKPFLYINAAGDNRDGHVCALFQYKSGKLREVVSVNKNSMKIRFYIMSFTTGPTQIDFDYVYTDGTLKPKSTTGTHHSMYMLVNGTNRKGIAGKTIPVYRSAGGSSKAYTLHKGNVVTILRCKYENRRMYIEVSYYGKKGWINAQKGYQGESGKLFSNVMYAG